jgi:hypothetical protein
MIETKILSLGVGSSFQILHNRIITPGGGVVIFVGMADATAESIKSLEGFRIAWMRKHRHSVSEVFHCFVRPYARRDHKSGPVGIPGGTHLVQMDMPNELATLLLQAIAPAGR